MKSILQTKHELFGGFLVAIGALIIIGLLYHFLLFRAGQPVFSAYTVLSSSWNLYKNDFIQDDGRVIDDTNGFTTSEGQSYAMLRAVWSDDKETFDRVWRWTQNNLDRHEDELFAWRWGQRADGSWGVDPDGGINSASDADVDIAVALIFAGKRWGDQQYVDDAKKMLADIWRVEVVEIQGQPYLTAGNWAQSQQYIVINPSYLAPYAWRIFHSVDPQRGWDRMVQPTYDLLFRLADTPLNADHSVGLPPNWVELTKDTAEIRAFGHSAETAYYSYDAVRTPWRVAVDYEWYQEPRAKEYLQRISPFLINQYREHGRLVSTYSHDGRAITHYESPVMYSTFLGALKIVDPTLATEVYENKILKLYSTDCNGFPTDVHYYEQNWLWFGLGLYFDQLPNLSAT